MPKVTQHNEAEARLEPRILRTMSSPYTIMHLKLLDSFIYISISNLYFTDRELRLREGKSPA